MRALNGAELSLVAALVATLLLSFPQAVAQPAIQSEASADEIASYETNRKQAEQLMRAGKFKEAATVAGETAKLAAKIYGADNATTAIALHNLGFILRRDKRQDEARTALERALAIYETKLPAVHADTTNAVGELGEIYVATGRGTELAAIYARLIERAGNEGNGRHISVAHMLANRGFVLRGLKRAEESEAAFMRAVALYEELEQIHSQNYYQTLDAVLERLTATKRDAEMVTRAKAALAKIKVDLPAGIAAAVSLHDRLSRSALDAGQAADAQAEAETALALIERHGAKLPPAQPGRLDPTVTALNNLARAHRATANYSAAEAAYRRAIKLLADRSDLVNEGIVTDNLAVLFLHQGRNDEAERFNKRGLALLEQGLGRTHPSVGRAAANLGALLSEMGRYAEAEPLLTRAIAIAEAQPTKDAVSIGIYRDNLAGLYRMSNRHEDAREQYKLALELFEGVLPPAHPRLATTRNNIGRYFLDIGRYAEAETELVRALALSQQIYGTSNFRMAIPAANLAEVYTATKRYPEARDLFGRALAALETVHGQRHANLLVTLTAAAYLELKDNKPAAARTLFDRAVDIELQERARSTRQAASRKSGSTTERGALAGLMEALWQAGKVTANPDIPRALALGQWESATPAAVALAAMGARAGAGNPALGALTRERQDLGAEWQATDKRITQQLFQSDARDDAQEQRLRTRLSAIETRLDAIDGDLSQRYPRYQELVRPVPLDVDTLRRLLRPSEAAIQITVTSDATHVIAVTGTAIRWHRAPVSDRELRTMVRNLRCGVDRAEWAVDEGKRCATLLGIDSASAPGPNDPLPFDVTGAHALYRILLEPLATTLAGKELLVVVSGALTSLPLHALVAEKPDGSAERVMANGNVDLARVAWLGRRHAITVLPSLASLAPLRQLAKASAGTQPYIGIGNPLLTGPDGTDRRAFEVPPCVIAPVAASKRRHSVTATSKARPSTLFRSGTSSVEDLRRQVPLPETAGELCQVAAFAKATGADVVTGADATEARIKALSQSGQLARARVVHFATHGLLADETAQFLTAKAEPSLLLTPPEQPSETDDGLLTASEVANLALDADWVVLSACNTASGDNVEAEALSGLARAFFYAGARSLLVSHWAVDSDATVKLITKVFDAMARQPGLTHGKALSQAMGSLIEGGGREAHPANWAPFIVVGGSAPVANASRK